jgi:hypothetical protein
MQHGTVLYVDLVADADRIHIATNDRIEPNGTIVAHDNISNNGGVFC